MLEPSLELYGETFDKVDVLLEELLTKTHARYALIIDLKGFVLMHTRALWAPKPSVTRLARHARRLELLRQRRHRTAFR